MLRILIETIAAFGVAVGFGILFNIKGKSLIIAGIGGAIGWFVYKITVVYMNFAPGAAFFSAGIAFNIYCEICARIYMIPSTILSACALIVLVPGFGVYRTIYEFILEHYVIAGNLLTETLASAGALALSLVFITSIFRNFNLSKFLKKTFNINLKKKDI
ncbi:threonine/serine exporter family protein [Peptacetobacter sp.]|uniref:threonine/serine exporter family protein n=1 Tax=Peptacetobacter sp. TaxID=2991975 RepID=UPI0026100F50|nr:threonine/serine exporter family protein [Peptacetobacter sp.]